jgi:hypothetical protein
LHLAQLVIFLHLTVLHGLQQLLAAEQTFKNSHHQVLTLNQLVQLLLWLKHGVQVVVLVAVVGALDKLVGVVVLVGRTHIVYLKPLRLVLQKQ